jgi:hypothetical protein
MAPPSPAEATADAGYGRAFGRVRYVRAGSEVELGASLLATNRLTLYLRPFPSGQLQALAIDANGTFVWPLKAGEYTLIGYSYTNSEAMMQRMRGRLMTAFGVPKAGQAVYVGDLRIDDRSGFTVLDRFGEALKQIEPRLSEEKLEAVKGLMRLEPRTGAYRRVVAVCNTVFWQLDCQGGFRGVEALRPTETANGFPITDSLTPELEWKPAGKSGVRYDVVIYETVSLAPIDPANIHRMRAAVVDYAEGLRESRYRPAAPLQPGQKYEWSVRLRDDADTVSSWSTTTYMFFAVVAALRESGRGFGFETPSR